MRKMRQGAKKREPLTSKSSASLGWILLGCATPARHSESLSFVDCRSYSRIGLSTLSLSMDSGLNAKMTQLQDTKSPLCSQRVMRERAFCQVFAASIEHSLTRRSTGLPAFSFFAKVLPRLCGLALKSRRDVYSIFSATVMSE